MQQSKCWSMCHDHSYTFGSPRAIVIEQELYDNSDVVLWRYRTNLQQRIYDPREH